MVFESVIFILLFILFLVAFGMASRYIIVPPNKAMVVYKRRIKDEYRFSVYVRGGRIIIPYLEAWTWLDLSIVEQNLLLKDIVTIDGKFMDLGTVLKMKIDPHEISLRAAASMHLKMAEKIRREHSIPFGVPLQYPILKQIFDLTDSMCFNKVEDHIRDICGKMSKDEITSELKKIGEKSSDSGRRDMRMMGRLIVSLEVNQLAERGNDHHLKPGQNQGSENDIPCEYIPTSYIPSMYALQNPYPFPSQNSSQQPSCYSCNGPMVFSQKRNRWFCTRCNEWNERSAIVQKYRK